MLSVLADTGLVLNDDDDEFLANMLVAGFYVYVVVFNIFLSFH